MKRKNYVFSLMVLGGIAVSSGFVPEARAVGTFSGTPCRSSNFDSHQQLACLYGQLSDKYCAYIKVKANACAEHNTALTVWSNAQTKSQADSAEQALFDKQVLSYIKALQKNYNAAVAAASVASSLPTSAPSPSPSATPSASPSVTPSPTLSPSPSPTTTTVIINTDIGGGSGTSTSILGAPGNPGVQDTAPAGSAIGSE